MSYHLIVQIKIAIEKEARGLKDDDLVIQEVRTDNISTTLGVVDKETFAMPKKMLQDLMTIIYSLI